MAQSAAGKSDQRWGVRVAYNRRITMSDRGLPRTARMRDISISGCFIETPSTIEVGSVLTVSFALDLKNGPTITTDAKVARITPEGVGARFLYGDAQTPVTLRRWIGSQQEESAA